MLNPDYRDILSAFNDALVEYVLVGAYALAAHGFVRATGDIDLFVRTSPENAERILSALQQFGAPLSGVRREDFETPGLVFQIGVAPRRIDILTVIDGVAFEAAWSERTEVEVDGISIPLISRTLLVRNKEASGRPQDLVDATWLRDQEDGA